MPDVLPDAAAGLERVREAHERIRDKVHETPVFTSRAIDDIAGRQLYFKAENLQRTGSFKFRGATHAVSLLTDEQRARGVVTHSSGNHAQALACAARDAGVPAYIVMPEGAPPVKRRATEGYGAKVVPCGNDLPSRESTAQAVVDETGATLVHPYDDARIIAGQGTAALELLERHPGLDAVVAPIGGGGLFTGTALVCRGSTPQVQAVAAEPEGANDAYRSFQQGSRIPTHEPHTIADGLRTTLGVRNFDTLWKLHEQDPFPIIPVSERQILDAMRLMWERLKLVVEPSGAVSCAAVLSEAFPDGMDKVGVIVSGGNVDAGALFGHLAAAPV